MEWRDTVRLSDSDKRGLDTAVNAGQLAAGNTYGRMKIMSIPLFSVAAVSWVRAVLALVVLDSGIWSMIRRLNLVAYVNPRTSSNGQVGWPPDM